MWYFICDKKEISHYRHYAPYEIVDLDKLEIMNKKYASELDFQYACIKDEAVRNFVLNCDNKTGIGQTTYMLITSNEKKANKIFNIAQENLKWLGYKYLLAYVKEGRLYSKEYSTPIEANKDFTILRKHNLKVLSIVKNSTYGCDSFKSYGFKFVRTHMLGNNDPDFVDKEENITIKTDVVEEGYYDQDIVDVTVKDSFGGKLCCYCQFDFLQISR